MKVSGSIKIVGFVNKKIVNIKVEEVHARYGVAFVVSFAHISKVIWNGTNHSVLDLAPESVSVFVSGDTMTIEMADRFQHGFVALGGSISTGEVATYESA